MHNSLCRLTVIVFGVDSCWHGSQRHS